ncbi:MarR family winged helix-turn-helix transcriptional regulator [Kineococcus sp. LSe6-4]|uniref:MarR family winged helix-turn-helix transcriptional regulator n=1 Tax=Kineococcus halophytocola TaxID=3234027 RepID=A0ABV4GYB6_9ACTN
MPQVQPEAAAPPGVSRAVLANLRAAAAVQAGLADVLRDAGLTVDRWRCLAHVAQVPGSSMSDVVDALLIAPATASRAVDALVDDGSLARALDPQDRRRVVLHVTRDGAQLLRRADAGVAAVARLHRI